MVESGGGSMESIIKTLEEERRGAQAQTKVAKPVRPPSKPPSSASSLLDLSQQHIRLSPLQVIDGPDLSYSFGRVCKLF